MRTKFTLANLVSYLKRTAGTTWVKVSIGGTHWGAGENIGWFRDLWRGATTVTQKQLSFRGGGSSGKSGQQIVEKKNMGGKTYQTHLVNLKGGEKTLPKKGGNEKFGGVPLHGRAY